MADKKLVLIKKVYEHRTGGCTNYRYEKPPAHIESLTTMRGGVITEGCFLNLTQEELLSWVEEIYINGQAGERSLEEILSIIRKVE